MLLEIDQSRRKKQTVTPTTSRKKGQKTPPGALAKSLNQRAVILEINPQYFGYTEVILPMRYRIKYISIQMMSQDNRLFSLTRWEIPVFTTLIYNSLTFHLPLVDISYAS